MNTIDILIVEDKPAIHQLLLDILALQPSYQAHSAYSGMEAMMLLKDSSRHFDLILLDLMLPGIWPESHFVEDNAINVHISNLRKKIAHLAGDQTYIETIWGINFKMA